MKWGFLVAGMLGILLLSRLGHPEVGDRFAHPVQGAQLADLGHGKQEVTIRGIVEHKRISSGRGLVLKFRCDDGTPVTIWVGPDIEGLPTVEPHQRLAVAGKPSGTLFVATGLKPEVNLSGGRTYKVGYYREGFAYIQNATGWWRVPVGSDWDTSRETVVVSWYGDRPVVR